MDYVDSTGVLVTMHEQYERPYPESFALNAPNGFVTSFGIRKASDYAYSSISVP